MFHNRFASVKQDFAVQEVHEDRGKIMDQLDIDLAGVKYVKQQKGRKGKAGVAPDTRPAAPVPVPAESQPVRKASSRSGQSDEHDDDPSPPKIQKLDLGTSIESVTVPDDSVVEDTDSTNDLTDIPVTAPQNASEAIGIRFLYNGRIKRITMKQESDLKANIPLLSREFGIKNYDRIMIFNQEVTLPLETKYDQIPDLNHLTGLLKIRLMTDEEKKAADFAAAAAKAAATTAAQAADPNSVTIDGHIRIKTMTVVKKSHTGCVKCISKCKKCQKSVFLKEFSGGRHTVREEISHVPEKEQLSGFMDKFKDQFRVDNANLIPEKGQDRIKFKFSFDGDEVLPDQTPDDVDLDHGCVIEVTVTDTRSCGIISCSCNSGRKTRAAAAAVAPESTGNFVFLDDDGPDEEDEDVGEMEVEVNSDQADGTSDSIDAAINAVVAAQGQDEDAEADEQRVAVERSQIPAPVSQPVRGRRRRRKRQFY